VSLGDPAARLTQAASLRTAGKRKEAQTLLEGLPGFRGSSARGAVALERGDAESALSHFTAATALAGGSELPWNALGGTELRRGNYRNALEAFDRTLTVDPECALAVNNRGVALWRLGRLREAAEAFDEAVRLDAGAAEFWVNLGIARSHAAAEKLAQRAFETAARLAPQWPKPLVEIARLRRRRGDKRGAKRLLGRAVALGWRAPNERKAPRRGSRRGSA
jgi:Flp pilus assembly protein TadD